MNKPIVGILSRIQTEKEDLILGIEEKFYIETDYIKAIILAGGIPIIIPVTLDDNVLTTQIKLTNGLLVPGGTDINSLIYGEEPIEKQGIIFDDIDNFDIKSVKIATSLNKPILGICKGMQVLNVAFGGTLYQDLSQIEECCIKHIQRAKKYFASHTVKIKQDTKLQRILGEKVQTNSYHHQAIKGIAEDFSVSATSLDGVVEAIESTGPNFILGIQWHPEMMIDCHPNMLDIFKKFIESTKCN